MPQRGRKVVMSHSELESVRLQDVIDCCDEYITEGLCPFEEMQESLETARKVAVRLGPEYELDAILRLCTFRAHDAAANRQMLQVVMNAMDAKKLDEFLNECLEMSKNEWLDYAIRPGDILAVLLQSATQTGSLRYLRTWANSKYLENVDLNDFWTNRIHRDVAKKDWTRAWDDLRHAIIGFPKGTMGERQRISSDQLRSWPYLSSNNVVLRRELYCTDRERCRELVRILYENMQKEGVLTPLKNEDMILLSDQVTISTVQRSAHADKALVRYDREIPIPGILEAWRFADDSQRKFPIQLDREGGMILKIAEVVQEKKRTNKERKLERKTAAITKKRD